MISQVMTNNRRCDNCRVFLEQDCDIYDRFCSKACEYEFNLEENSICKSCKGTGLSGAENARGEQLECRKCYGTGSDNRIR